MDIVASIGALSKRVTPQHASRHHVDNLEKEVRDLCHEHGEKFTQRQREVLSGEPLNVVFDAPKVCVC